MRKVESALGLTAAIAVSGTALVAGGVLVSNLLLDNVEESGQLELTHPVETTETAGTTGTAETAESSEYVVEHLECDDPEALEEKAEHNADREQPIGWPLEYTAGEMPDPLCHPDYLEISEWVDYEEFHESWEGIETSNIVHDGTRSQESINVGLWEQSMARFQWSEDARRSE